MYCKKCGTQIDDDSVFCHKCGTRISPEAGESDNSLPAQDKGNSKGKKKLWIIPAVIFAVITTVVALYIGGFFDPCRKGHTYVPSDEGCQCDVCGNVIDHSLTSAEEGCSCSVCGFIKEHSFIKTDDHFECQSCGYIVSSFDYLVSCIKEIGVYNDGVYYLLKETEKGATGNWSLVYNPEEDSIYFVRKAETLSKQEMQLRLDRNDDMFDFVYYLSKYKDFSVTVTGSYNKKDFNKNTVFPEESCTFSSSQNLTALSQEISYSTAGTGIALLVSKCSEIFVQNSLDISLEDLGFISFR